MEKNVPKINHLAEGSSHTMTEHAETPSHECLKSVLFALPAPLPAPRAGESEKVSIIHATPMALGFRN